MKPDPGPGAETAPDFRSDFDLEPGLLYLNSGSQSICPRSVSQAVQRNLREYEHNATGNLFGIWERLWQVQKKVAAFFQASPNDLFFRTSVSAALNDLILGMPLAPGGEILVTDLEYGAITAICRFKAEASGQALRSFPLPKTPEELKGLGSGDLRDLVLRQLRTETRMLMISEVSTGTGLVLPIQEIARETRRRGILLVVDAAHSPGALPVDFRELADVDLYGGNLHKWMMGPKGTAFGWVAPRHQNTIQPIQAGWTTFDLPPAFKAFGENGGQSSFASRFMISASQDFSGFFALDEMVDYWNRRGPGNIRDRIRQLNQHVELEMARELGWSCHSPESALRGPLISYRLPDPLAAMGYELMRRLLREHQLQLVVPVIGGRHCLRFSPHIHNTRQEITQAVRILKNFS